MNIKSERGFTGIDVTVAILVITVFIALISVLLASLDSNSKSISRRTEATYQAVNLIEEQKAKNIEELQDEEGYIENTPYYKEIKVEDYKDIRGREDIEEGIVKKVTVTVSYKDGKEEKKIELSTIVSKGN